MTKTKSTKRALLLSALSLLMCVSMLIGSTFAWFTDSVTSAGNKIQAGTLQVDLELLGEDNTTWTSIKESQDAIFNYENWEPGYTDVKILRVSNKGTLALKWLAKFVSNYELSALADVIDVYVNTEISSYPTDRSDLSGWTNIGTVRQFVNTISATTKGTLEAGASANLGIALKMQETAGNGYQGMDLGGTFDIQIIATQYTSEEDSFDKNYDMNAAIYVDSQSAAQDALDNAKKGDVIVLASGVDYGTLLLQPVDGKANTTTSLNEADGEGLTGYRNEYIRTVEDLTILGTTNAKVDAIKVVSGYIEGSGSSCNLVDVKGLVIDSVEFTDEADCAPHTYSAPIFFNLTWTDVDGLTVKNCKLIGNDDKVNFVYFTIDGSSAFDGVASNVTLTGNTVDGIARLCELRQTENVTITDNVIKNTVLHGILLPVHNGSYSGAITITGNTAYGINERFVRMAGAGDANVVIKNNTINAYLGEDADYIKVTDGNNVTVENNTMTRGANDADSLTAAIANGGEIVLTEDITMDVAATGFTVANGTTATLNLNGHDIVATSAVDNASVQLFSVNGTLDIVGNGTISLTSDNFAWSTNYRYCAINIREAGVVTLGEGVEVVCEASKDGSYGMSYAVDIYTTGTLNVNGASLHSNYIAVRCFFGASVVNVTSGSITSSRNNWGIWPQSSPNAVITIANGIDYTTDEYGIYIFN